MPRHLPIQHSFNGGEFSTRMYGRTDLEKYRAAAELIQNFDIIPQGGIVRRSGSRYVSNAAFDHQQSRLVPFVYSDVQSYVLEWSEFKLRFFANEGLLLQQALTGILPATDVDITTNEFEVVGHGYKNLEGPVQFTTTDTLPGGVSLLTNYYVKVAQALIFDAADVYSATDEIEIVAHDLQSEAGPYRITSTGTLPPPLAYDTDYYIATGPTANRFKLSLSRGGAVITLTGAGSFTHTLTPTSEYVRDKFRVAASPSLPGVDLSDVGLGLHTMTPNTPTAIELTTPYSAAEAQDLSFAQSADVLYVAHKNHPPHVLSRASFQGFSLGEVDFQDGPYLDENTTEITLSSAATTGKNITLTASEALFVGTDVGRHVRIYDDDATNGLAWGWAKITSVNQNVFQDADVIKATMSSVDTGLDQITMTGSHLMNTGDLVRIKEFTGTLPGGLSEAQTYYVNAVSGTVLAFYDTKDDAINDTDRVVLSAGLSGTVRVTSSVISITAHGFLGGEGAIAVTNVGGALPVGLATGTDYYVLYVDADNLSLSLSRGGDPVPIDDAETGGGLHYMQGDASTPAVTCQISIERDFQATSAVATWRLGAWGARSNLGYPRAVTFHEQRLWWAGNVGDPQKLWGSRTAKFADYAPTGTEGEDIAASPPPIFGFTDIVYDTNAVTHEIGAAKENVIRWLAAERSLILGTSSACFQAGAAISSEAITPANFGVKRAGSHGAAAITPVIVDDRVVYISDTGQKVFSLGYSFQSDNYLAEDLTLLAEHIGLGDIVAQGFAHEPNSTIWYVRGDGVMMALSLVRDQQISGWARHVLGGVGAEVESVAVISSPIGDPSAVGRANRNHDQVWISVKRTVGGATERWVEFFEDIFEANDILEDAFFLDGGASYIGSATNTPGPFNHLKGETVDVLADGRQHLDLVVDASTGLITLPGSATASKVHAGYRMTSNFRSLRLPIQSQEGAAEVNLARIDHLILRLDLSLGGRYGPDENDLTRLGRQLIPPSTPMDDLPPLYSDDIEVDFDGGWATKAQFYIRQDDPLPFSLLAVALRLQKSARGDRARSGG